jgi:hypothetical protein
VMTIVILFQTSGFPECVNNFETPR